MRRLATSLGLLLSIGLAGRALGDGPDLPGLRVTLANEAIPVGDRARMALEGSASLDQAAQLASLATERRSRWSQAVAVLDEFLEKHPEVESAPLIRFQGRRLSLGRRA